MQRIDYTTHCSATVYRYECFSTEFFFSRRSYSWMYNKALPGLLVAFACNMQTVKVCGIERKSNSKGGFESIFAKVGCNFMQYNHDYYSIKEIGSSSFSLTFGKSSVWRIFIVSTISSTRNWGQWKFVFGSEIHIPNASLSNYLKIIAKKGKKWRRLDDIKKSIHLQSFSHISNIGN